MRLRPHWRKMTWVLWLWFAAVIFFIVGINTWANNSVREECVGDAFECDIAISIASGVWTVIAVVLGFMGFVVLSLIWFTTRPKQPKVVYVSHGRPLPPPPPGAVPRR